MTDLYSGDINPDFNQRYDNLATSITGGTVAAFVDFGASVWNSLPFTEEVSTYDLLQKLDKNALAVYEENPDTIKTASFIGGIFLPAGLALKGMNAARSGAKGVGWFSQAGKEAKIKDLDALFRAGPDATKAYRRAKRSMYARGFANDMADVAAMEVAILGTMNAHPYMEDYIKDPVKHVAISLALGGVIGGAIGHISSRHIVKQVEGGVISKAWDTVFEGYKPLKPSIPLLSKLQIRATNIETLEALLAKKEIEPWVQKYAKEQLLVEKVEQLEEFKVAAKALLGDIKNPAEQQILMERLAKDIRFQGAETVDFLKMKATGSATSVYQQAKIQLSEKMSFAEFFSEKGTLRQRAYSPEFDLFGSAEDIANVSRASVLGETPASITRGYKTTAGAIKSPDSNIGWEIMNTKAPELDRIYLQQLAHIDRLTPAQIAKAAIAPDDLPLINALVAKAMKNPDMMEGVKIKLTRLQPNYEKYQASVIRTSGVKATHFSDISALAQRGSKYNLGTQPLAKDTLDFLSSWTTGGAQDKALFRQAFTAYRQKGYTSSSRPPQMAKELYESSASTQARAELLANHADAEGNIYLYRGMRSEAKGHGPIDSYTPSRAVAASFAGGDTAKARIYKVHVDDIIGVVDNGHKELEFLVLAPARQVEEALPIAERTGQLMPTKGVINSSIEEVSLSELSARLVTLKENSIVSMAKQGVPREIISIRTNTPVNTVHRFLEDGGQTSLIDLLDENLAYMTYRNAEHLDEYLNPLMRPLVMQTNRNKIPYAELSANLDVMALNRADKDIISSFLQTSKSEIARDLGDYFFSEARRPILDILRAQFTKAVDGFAGLKFVQSTDFYVRDMGEFGKIASVIGKDVMAHGNRAVKKILVPITHSMEAITKKPELLIETNTALAHNAQLRGYRVYKDRQFWQHEDQVVEGVKKKVLVPAKFQGKELKIVSDEVDTLLTQLAESGREMYHLKNTANKIQGKRGLTDLGFWTPAFNPVGKHISYVWNQLDDTTSLLWGNTAEELLDAMSVFKTAQASKIANGSLRVVEKGEASLYGTLAGRTDPFTTTIANVEKMHKGSSAPTIVKANADIFTDITQSYEHYVQASVRNLADMSMSDITTNLMRMSKIEGLPLEGQALGTVGKWLAKKEDHALIMRNTLLGVNNVNQAPAWQSINQSFETGVGVGIQKAKDIWRGALETLPLSIRKKVLAGEDASLQGLDYEQVAKKLEAAGIVNPWQVFDDEAAKIFGVARLTDSRNVTPRLVFASNAMAATLALRFGEVAQPIVNAISLPILTMSAISERLPATFMGIQKSTAKVPPLQVMHEGVRAAFTRTNPQFNRWSDAWEKAGYFKPLVSEASDVLRLAREFEPGAISQVEKLLDSQMVRLGSSFADYSEATVRRVSMFTGGMLAKRLYPEIDDVGVTIFARDFMDKAVGNYHAAQRPTLFQGTLGAAMSLFQTYMLTMSQQMYKHLEIRDFKAAAKMMLTQTTIFGTGSLPGFNPISEMIGEHYSDDNFDLVTGTFRALPDPMANLVLYGVPSSMGPALYSRGELAPRVPAGISAAPAVSMAGQAIQGVISVAKAMGSENEDVGRALLQALSMQSVSRPLARLSEVGSGYSVTRQGNTIAVPEEVWTPLGVFARMLTTRPLEEAKLRDAIHLNTMYGSLDREARQKVTAQLKTALRNNSLSDEKLAAYAEEYLRTGTPQGWRAAVNMAIAETNVSGKQTFVRKMKLDNPLMHMIDQMDGDY